MGEDRRLGNADAARAEIMKSVAAYKG